jgi:hypothetical protein
LTTGRNRIGAVGGAMLVQEVQPIHVGTLKGLPLRFYPPQSNDDMMPRAAVDDLATALSLTRVARRKLKAAKTEFPDLAKRIRTEGGALLDVFAFQGRPGSDGRNEAGRNCR